MTVEIWKHVKNYEGVYMVSNLGRVKSFKRKKYKVLSATPNSQGYRVVRLSNGFYVIDRTIHQLVAESFLNHTVNGRFLIVDHINNNKLDNTVSNLQIISARENASKDKKGGSSQYVGVSYDKFRCKWKSNIRIDGVQKYIGRFDTEIEASEAYKKMLSTLNFIGK